MTKTDALKTTPILHATATTLAAKGNVVAEVYTNETRDHFRLVVGERVHAGWRGDWEGFMECAQQSAPQRLRYTFVGDAS